MKGKILLMAALAVALVITGTANAHLFGPQGQGNPYFMPAVPAEYIPTYDGDLSDWAWFPPAYIFPPEWFIGIGNWTEAEAEVPKDDFDVLIYGPAWIPSQNMVTFALHKVDDIFFVHGPDFNTSSDEDVCQFTIDADHGGEDPGQGNDYQQAAFSPKLGGMMGCYPGGGTVDWAFQPPYAFFGMQPAVVEGTNGTFDMEMQTLIWDWIDASGEASSILHQLQAGQIIGFSVEVIDTEEGVSEFPDVEFDFGNTANGGTILPDYFLMSEADTRPLIPTAVENTSWGRIKESLQ